MEPLKAAETIQKIMDGKKARISKGDIVNLIISLQDAYSNLSEDEYNKVYEIFMKIRADKKAKKIDRFEYMKICSDIIENFENIAPFEFYDGEKSIKYTKEPDYIKSKRIKLRKLEKLISTQYDMLERAKADLGGMTIDQYKNECVARNLSKEETENILNSVETLSATIEFTTTNIENLNTMHDQLKNELSMVYVLKK